MFSYYGTKRSLAGLYAPPEFDVLIEPFAGAAGYSLHGDNWKKQVQLYDANPKIVAVWSWLIKATPADILALPDLSPGDSVADFDLEDAPKWLVGFCINPGSTSPKITASSRTKWSSYKKRMAEEVHKIKHWTVTQKSYADIPNQIATWFIDPPYQVAGKYYFGFGSLDFKHLGDWCQSRHGQVIVCENMGANWLPFRFLANHRGSVKTNTEAIWDNGDWTGMGALL